MENVEQEQAVEAANAHNAEVSQDTREEVIVLSIPDAQAIANYLQSRPYQESAALLEPLKNARTARLNA